MNRAPAAHPELEIVIATSEDNFIGRDNQLPWRLPDDLKRFKALTLGNPVLMGRKTYESIGRALPGRVNIVLSRAASFAPDDAIVVRDIDAAMLAAQPAPRAMVIGGADIYSQTLARAKRIHLTLVHTKIRDGDAVFRGWRDAPWREVFREHHAADSRHAHSFSFITLTSDSELDPARG